MLKCRCWTKSALQQVGASRPEAGIWVVVLASTVGARDLYYSEPILGISSPLREFRNTLRNGVERIEADLPMIGRGREQLASGK